MTKWASLVLVVLLAGCSSPGADPVEVGTGSPGAPSPSVDPTAAAEPSGAGVVMREGWRLREVTADGRHVALVVEHGACDGYLGPRVTADEEGEVVIEVAYDPPEGVVSCEAIGLAEREVVELPTPLEGRLLTGCGEQDCRAVPSGGGGGSGAAVAAGVAVVVVDDGVVGIDVTDGGEVWRIPHDEAAQRYLERPTAFGDVVLLVDQSAAMDVIAVDAATGERRWEASGHGWYDGRPATTGPAGGELALLTPTAGLVETAAGWQGGVVEARRPDGTVAWTAPVDGPVFEVDIAGEVAVVLSGRNMDAAEQLGRTVVTSFDVRTGAVRWQTPLAGQPYDAVLRPDPADGALIVVDVLGATYALSLADGSEVWRNVPLNYGGMVDVGPWVLLRPGRYGDPHLLLDPATGAEVGTVEPSEESQPSDIGAYPRLGEEIVMPIPGSLIRRDVGTTPLTEPDPSPVWTADLFAQAGPPALTDMGTVVVPTPLGARAHDATTGELVWAFADLP